MEVAVADSDQECSVDALMSVVQSLGGAESPAAASSVVPLVAAVGATTRGDSLLSPGVPRAAYVSRLLHMLSLEAGAGHGMDEGLKRAVMAILPPFVPVLDEILMTTQGSHNEEEALPVASAEIFGSAIVSSGLLSPEVSSCLALLAHTLCIVDNTTIIGPVLSPGAALSICGEKAHEAVRGRELAASGALYSSLLADTRAMELVDRYASLESSSLVDALLLELVHSLSRCTEMRLDTAMESDSWRLCLVREILLSLSGMQPSQDKRTLSLHDMFAELWAAYETNLPILADFNSGSIVSSDSVETLFLANGGLTGAGDEQTSVACLVKWKGYGDRAIMAHLWQQQQETRLRAEISSAMSITPQTQFSSLYSLAYAIESDRLVLDTPEAMALLAAFKLVRACNEASKEGMDVVAKMETVELREAWTDVLVSPLEKLVEHGAVLLEVLLASPYSSEGSLVVPWEPILIATGWVRESLTSLEEKVNSQKTETFDGKSLTGIANRISQTFRLMEQAIRRFWGLPLLSQQVHLWEIGGHAAVPSNEEGWKLLTQLRGMATQSWIVSQGGPQIKDGPSNAGTLEIYAATALPSCANTTVPFGLSSLVRQYFFPGVSTSLVKEWLALYATFYWARTSEADIGQEPQEAPRGGKAVDFATLAAALSSKIADHVVEKRKQRRKALERLLLRWLLGMPPLFCARDSLSRRWLARQMPLPLALRW